MVYTLEDTTLKTEYRVKNRDEGMLKSDKSPRSLKLQIKNATHLQLWTTTDGKFICLEPWYGSITSLPSKGIESNWKERPGTLHISTGKEFISAYYVTISK